MASVRSEKSQNASSIVITTWTFLSSGMSSSSYSANKASAFRLSYPSGAFGTAARMLCRNG